MNFIATVNTPAHGHISVTFSDNEKSVLGAWRDNVTIDLSGKEKQQITNDIICNRRHKRVFEKSVCLHFGIWRIHLPGTQRSLLPVKTHRVRHADRAMG